MEMTDKQKRDQLAKDLYIRSSQSTSSEKNTHEPSNIFLVFLVLILIAPPAILIYMGEYYRFIVLTVIIFVIGLLTSDGKKDDKK